MRLLGGAHRAVLGARGSEALLSQRWREEAVIHGGACGHGNTSSSPRLGVSDRVSGHVLAGGGLAFTCKNATSVKHHTVKCSGTGCSFVRLVYPCVCVKSYSGEMQVISIFPPLGTQHLEFLQQLVAPGFSFLKRGTTDSIRNISLILN